MEWRNGARRRPLLCERRNKGCTATTDFFSARREAGGVGLGFKAGLWEGSFNAPKTLVYLPSAKHKGRFETQFAIKDARLQSIINSFGSAQTEPGVVQCNGTAAVNLIWRHSPVRALGVGEAETRSRASCRPTALRVGRCLAPRFRTDGRPR